jgi:tetratricopeptide (TPR) repeat protein
MYGLLRQYDKARENYRHSFELSKTPQALAGYGTSDFEENNFKECAAVFDAVDRGAGDYLKQNPQLYYVMGKCYQQTGQRDKARLAYTRFQAFVKPGSQLAQQVKKAIDSLNHTDPPRPAPKPALKATPKPSVKVTPKPSASPH